MINRVPLLLYIFPPAQLPNWGGGKNCGVGKTADYVFVIFLV